MSALFAPRFSRRTGFIADDLPSRSAWRKSELDTIRREYPAGGSLLCVRLLPHRTKLAIRERARLLGVRVGQRP